jgi:hypothetical protein
LLRCRRCGRKLGVRYGGAAPRVPRYVCHRGATEQAEPRCISLGAADADEAVGRELLRVVQPAAVEAARMASRQATSRQDELVQSLRLELQAARYEAERIRRQYDAAEPEHRLVAGELERRWDAALEKANEVQERLQREQAHREAAVTPAPEVFSDLAGNLARVWHDSSTDVRLKKRLARTLIREIVVDVQAEAGQVEMILHWQGGVHTLLHIHRRRRGESRRAASTEVVEAVRQLAWLCPDLMIAGFLNRNGLRTGQGNRWTRMNVCSLRSKHAIGAYCAARRREEGWMNLTQAAKHLRISPPSLRRAAEQGVAPALHPLQDGPWIFKREHLESASMQAFVARIARNRQRVAVHNPKQLTLFPSTT